MSLDILNIFDKYIPWWEQLEILSYPKIFYLGLGVRKNDLVNNITTNFGFDYADGSDKTGMYKMVCCFRIHVITEVKVERVKR